MSTLQILSEFSDLGVKVKVEGRDLALCAPKGALNTSLVSMVKEAKPVLIANLDRIRRRAGADWDFIAADPAQLRAFAELLMIEGACLILAGKTSSASTPTDSSSAPWNSSTSYGLNGAECHPAVPLKVVVLSPAPGSRTTVIFWFGALA